MNVTLTRDMEEYVTLQVKSGKFSSPSEVVVNALKSQIEQTTLDEFEERLEHGEEQIKRGEFVLADDDFYERKKEMIRQKYMNNNQNETV